MGLMAPAFDALRLSAAAQLSSFAQVTLLNPKTRSAGISSGYRNSVLLLLPTAGGLVFAVG